MGVGTSFAQPLIAGAAVDIRHWWLVNGSTLGYYGTGFINDPGFTISQILLMGDREASVGSSPTTTGFDPIYGNGRFRARMFESAGTHSTAIGMDPPWGARVSAFYVNEGSTYNFYINGGMALPADATRLTVALFWPEENLAGGGDITMTVRATCGSAYPTARQDMSYDTKKRVYIDDVPVGGTCWRVEIRAWEAPTSTWYGGLNRRYVYLAYYYEDDQRDDLWNGIQ